MIAAQPALLPDAPPQLPGAIAGVLAALAGELEQLGSSLCSDLAVAERHIHDLQTIDRCAQSLSQLAMVLQAPDPAGAAAHVTLGDLRCVLLAACAGNGPAIPTRKDA